MRRVQSDLDLVKGTQMDWLKRIWNEMTYGPCFNRGRGNSPSRQTPPVGSFTESDLPMSKTLDSCRRRLLLCVMAIVMTPTVLLGQDKVIIVRHGSTPEGDIIRARADALLLLKQAELTGEKAYAQQLENLIRECDVVYKRFSTRNEIRKEALEDKFDRTFDIIKFNQQLADIRGGLEHKAVIQHTRIGNLTDEMNHLLEITARQSLNATAIPAMKTELTPEQLDAIFLTDGSNTFSGKTGKTRLEAFKWPFVIQRKEFERERDAFEKTCDQAVKEIDANNSPSPETIGDLLKQADAIDKKLDSLPLSDSQNVRAVETKWRKEAKAFIRELNRTLGNCSRLDSEKLAKYVFQGKTLGELVDHLNSKGLRFSYPGEQDANLYASIFFIMRYAYQECEKAGGGSSADTNNAPAEPQQEGRRRSPKSQRTVDLLSLVPDKIGKNFLVLGPYSTDKPGTFYFPYDPPGEYDLMLTFSTNAFTGMGFADFIPLLPVADKTYAFCVRMGEDGKDRLGFFPKDGVAKEWATLPTRLKPDHRYTIALEMRREGVKARLDGTVVFAREYTVLHAKEGRQLGFVLSPNGNQTVIHEAKIRVVTP